MRFFDSRSKSIQTVLSHHQTVRRGRGRLAKVSVALFIGMLVCGLQSSALCDIFLFTTNGPVDVTPEITTIDGQVWVMADNPFEITVDFVHGQVYDMSNNEIGYVDTGDSGGVGP